MKPSVAILDGEMELQNGEIEHHMDHQNGEMGHQNGEMEHHNEEMEHQNGEMNWFGYTPGCKRLIQPPRCNSTTTRMLNEVLISYTATIFLVISYTAQVFFPDRAHTDSANIARTISITLISYTAPFFGQSQSP